MSFITFRSQEIFGSNKFRFCQKDFFEDLLANSVVSHGSCDITYFDDNLRAQRYITDVIWKASSKPISNGTDHT